MRPNASTARIVTTAAALLPLALAVTVSAPAGAAAVPKGTLSARVVKIVDGDTVDVMRAGTKFRVQLLEVDTPERGQCWFKASAARTAALLPPGTTAYLLADRTPKDRYGRRLFYVWNAKGLHVNRNLVRYGYGKAVLVKPDDKYIAVFKADEAKARAERLRIWSGRCDTTGSTPSPSPPPRPTKTPQPTKTPRPTATPRPTTSQRPTPTPTTSAPPSGTDPRFRTCAEANAAGYGPYRRGVDPEYAWYQDRDGDGIVCER